MKKIGTLLLILALAFSLCACDTIQALREVELPPLPQVTVSPEPTSEPTPDSTAGTPEKGTEPAAAAPEATPEPVLPGSRVTVNIGKTERKAYDPEEGKRQILYFAYETPSVRIGGNGQAADKINDYLALLDETWYTGNDYGAGNALGYNTMLELAEDNYRYVAETGDENQPLLLSAVRNAAVLRGDGALLSLAYDDYSNTGDGHAIYGLRGYVFDTETGEHLSLEDLTEDYGALSSFLIGYMVGLTEKSPEVYAGIDLLEEKEMYPEAFGALLRDGSWYLDEAGLLIFSDLEEISSYANGMIRFRVPYSELKGKIYDKYLPQARQGSGELSLLPMEQVDDGALEIVDLVTAGAEEAPSGEAESTAPARRELCLRIKGTVYDLRISQGNYTDAFYATAQLWYASFLHDCGLQLSAPLPEGTPELEISYTDAEGQSHVFYLSRSENGGAALTDEVQAVG